MAHGTPDWGVTAGAVTIYKLTDMAELAARLGSILTHDRRGDVVWFDGFEDGLEKWSTFAPADGGSVDLSTVRARNGQYSARLVADEGGAVGTRIDKTIPFPVESPMGAEFSFALQQNIGWLELVFDIYDGVRAAQYVITWSDTDNNLTYHDVEGDPQEIAAGVDLSMAVNLFHTMKLVVDMENHAYARLILNQTEYSLAGIAAWNDLDPTSAALRVRINMAGRAGENDVIRVDDVIITQNEPV